MSQQIPIISHLPVSSYGTLDYECFGAGVCLHVLSESELGVLVTHKVVACCLDETVDYLLFMFQ